MTFHYTTRFPFLQYTHSLSAFDWRKERIEKKSTVVICSSRWLQLSARRALWQTNPTAAGYEFPSTAIRFSAKNQ